MKKILLSIMAIFLFSSVSLIYGQTDVEVFIKATDSTVTEVEGTTVTVYLSSDDVEQEQDKMDALFDDDLDAGWDGAETDLLKLHVGLRFTEVPIPQGSTIGSACVEMWSHEAKNAEDVCNLNIFGEATDSAETFTLDALITDRTMTTATVRWEIAEAWDLWRPYSTADISPIIQEIVNRDGWVSGNALALIFLGEDNQGPTLTENAREFESFENIADASDVGPDGPGDGANHPERVPKLMVTYFPTSVEDVKGQQQFVNIYPNPSNGILNLSFQSYGDTQMKIFNAKGQLVMSAEITSETTTWDVSNLQSGIYFLEAVQNNKTFTQKLLLK
ncbi:MAG: T9SS type A sorting domain-containing protein [Bacteroidales bacterium]|nr:T9SS type A sorting domain-containing protein [Bacteroidales bacterium]